MNWTRWLIRSKRWAAHPPPMRKVLFYGAVVLACLVIAGVEFLFGWPDWLVVNSLRKLP
ncbi:MAG: hypothetical protein R3D63_06935 [Paracoccaceae bacterium]